MQSLSSSPFARADAQAQARTHGPPLTHQPRPTPATAAAGDGDTDVQSADVSADARQLTPPLVGKIPLRGILEENLVYDGVLDMPGTLALVRALEAASGDIGTPIASPSRQ